MRSVIKEPYDIGPNGHYDITRGVMAYIDTKNGVSPLALFGPVHKAVLQQFYK